MRVELPRATFRGDEQVDVEVTLVNQGTETEDLGGSAFELSAFRLDLKRADGSPVARTAFGNQTLTPPTAVLKNASTFVPPGGERRITFPLRRMFDLSAGGSFSLRVSRVFEKYVRTTTNQFRDASTTVAARPVAFSVAPASPLTGAPPIPTGQTLLLSLNGHTRQGQSSGEVAAFLVRTDGSLAPRLNPVTLVPSDSSSLVVARRTNTAYIAREGALQVFQVREGGWKPLGPSLHLKPHVFGLALNKDQSRLLAFSGWGVQQFLVGQDGTIHETSAAGSIPAEDYAWSPNGRWLYASNNKVFAFGTRPGQGFAPLGTETPVGERPRELFVSPDNRFLLCGTSVSAPGPDSFKDALALVQLRGDGTLEPEPKLWRSEVAFGTHALGFDPTGRFALALCGGELLVFRVENGELKLASRCNASFGSSHSEHPSLVFASDGRTFFLNSDSLVAFRLGSEGQVEILGRPMTGGFDTRALVLTEGPVPVQSFQAIGGRGRVWLEEPVIAPEEPVWLDLELGEGAKLPELKLARLGNEWDVAHPQQVAPQAVARLEAGHSLSSHAPGRRVRLDLSRAFDLSCNGIYSLHIGASTGSHELRFEIGDFSPVIASYASPAQRNSWRLGLLNPQTSDARGKPVFYRTFSTARRTPGRSD